MQKVIELARKMSKELDKNWLPEIENINLHKLFSPVFKLNANISDLNRVVIFIILAYDPESQWLDIRKDRYDNKKKILINIDANINSELFQSLLSNSHDIINDVILDYLHELTDWRWKTVATLIDYHSNMIRFVHKKTESEKSIDKINKEGGITTLTEDYDIDTITKVNKQKGELLESAISARDRADKLIAEINRDYVATEDAVQKDFGFSFTETAKKKNDIMSWRAYIREKNEKKNLLL